MLFHFPLSATGTPNLQAIGAAIAEVDSVIAESRNASNDVFYKLGFDIATGIFGDPALGAQGNTETGPGSLGIRDSLSRAGQRGFNDSVKLNLSRRVGTPINKNSISKGPKIGETTARPEPAAAEIRCRGYRGVGGMSFVFNTVNTKAIVTGETIVTLEMAFTPAVKAAEAQTVAACNLENALLLIEQ